MKWHEYKKGMTFGDEQPICIWDNKKNEWRRVKSTERVGQFIDDRGRFYKMDNVTHVMLIQKPEVSE